MAVKTLPAIRRITIDCLLQTAPHLMRSHWEEVGRNAHATRLNPDSLRYKAIEQADNLFVYAAYDEDERIIGYSVCLINTHLHDQELLYGISDALFVSYRYRGTGLGSRLMRETAKEAKRRGCELMQWHAMLESDLDLLLCRHPRYQPQDVTYTEKL